MQKLNVITLFSGYDSQCLALNRLGVDYDLVAWCEIDKHAINAHNALFPQYADRNLGDISTVDWSAIKEPIDLLTYSSPCQDFSSAGLQRGGDEGSGTRSCLLWEVEKAIKALRPRYLVFENVAALVSDKFIGVFNKWQARLNEYGYTNFQQLMNAKDYGVPQNRLRIFMVSVLNCNKQYHFPKPFKLEKRLKDVLEQNVDERYYLSNERVAKLMQENETHRERGNGFAFKPHSPEEIASTVKCSGIGDKTDNFIAEPQMLGWTRNEKGEITDRHPVSIANCVTAAKRNNTQNYVMEPTIAAMRVRDKDNPNDRGKSTDNYAQRLELKTDGTSNTLTSVAKDNLLIEPTVIQRVGDRNNPTLSEKGIAFTINANPMSDRQQFVKEPTVMQIGNLKDDSNSNFKNTQTGRVYSPEGLSPTINTCQGGQREQKIIEDFYGTVRDPRVYTDEAPTLRADRTGLMATEGIRIRRLTERELYRLMDMEESDINTLLNSGIAKTQHAKLAGNSIVVSCLYYIFDRLLVHTEAQENEQLTLF